MGHLDAKHDPSLADPRRPRRQHQEGLVLEKRSELDRQCFLGQRRQTLGSQKHRQVRQ